MYHFIHSVDFDKCFVAGNTTLGFFSLNDSSLQHLDNELDSVSDPIYIPYGFPFGNETLTKAFVS